MVGLLIFIILSWVFFKGLKAAHSSAVYLRYVGLACLLSIAANFFHAYYSPLHADGSIATEVRSSFLFDANAMLSDYLDIVKAVRADNPYANRNVFAYGPVLMAWITAFSNLPSVAVFTFFVLASLGTIFVLGERWLRKRIPGTDERLFGILLIVLAAYPILFAIDRGNVEIFMAAILTTAIYLFFQGRTTAFVALIALSAAIKPQSLVFGLFLLRRRDYKSIALLGVLTALLFVAGFLILSFQTGLPAHELTASYESNLRHYGASVDSLAQMSTHYIHYSHTFWSQLSLLQMGSWVNFGELPIDKIYRGSALAFAATLTYRTFCREISDRYLYLNVICFITFWPQVSYDYTLIHFVPFIFFFLSDFQTTKSDRWVVFLTTLLFLPFHFVILHEDVFESVMVYGFALAGLSYLGFRQYGERNVA